MHTPPWHRRMVMATKHSTLHKGGWAIPVVCAVRATSAAAHETCAPLGATILLHSVAWSKRPVRPGSRQHSTTVQHSYRLQGPVDWAQLGRLQLEYGSGGGGDCTRAHWTPPPL